MAESPTAAHLLALADQLKQAATRSGRLDVAAKADEAIGLLRGAGAEQPEQAADAGNAVLKFFDGLGF